LWQTSPQIILILNLFIIRPIEYNIIIRLYRYYVRWATLVQALYAADIPRKCAINQVGTREVCLSKICCVFTISELQLFVASNVCYLMVIYLCTLYYNTFKNCCLTYCYWCLLYRYKPHLWHIIYLRRTTYRYWLLTCVPTYIIHIKIMRVFLLLLL